MAIGLTTECVEHFVWRLAECAFSANRRIVFSNAVGSHFTLFWPGRCPAWKNPESCWRRTPRESKQLGTGDWEVVTPQNLRSKCQSIRRKSGWDSVNSKGEKKRSCFLQTLMVSMTHCCDFWRSPLPSLPITPGCMVGSRRGLRRAQSSWNVVFFDLTARHHVQGASWWLFCTNSWVEFHDWSPKKRGSPLWKSIFGSDFWVRFWSPHDFLSFAKDFWKHFHVGSWVAVWLGWSGKCDTNWERIKGADVTDYDCDWATLKAGCQNFFSWNSWNSVGTVPFKPRKN